MSILKKEFFERPTLQVAKELLGKFLVRKIGNKKFTFMIIETEAYEGPYDKASHAHKGKTIRNSPMFGKAGVWYVYFVYGMHNMLNIVTGDDGYPAAVLIRGVQPLSNQVAKLTKLDGPAKITKFLKIDRKFNNKPATLKTGLWIED